MEAQPKRNLLTNRLGSSFQAVISVKHDRTINSITKQMNNKSITDYNSICQDFKVNIYPKKLKQYIPARCLSRQAQQLYWRQGCSSYRGSVTSENEFPLSQTSPKSKTPIHRPHLSNTLPLQSSVSYIAVRMARIAPNQL